MTEPFSSPETSQAEDEQDFDLEEVYDQQIAPLMDQIVAICKEHRFPMLADFNYRHEGEDHSHCTTILFFDRETPAKMVKAAKLLEPQRPGPMLQITATHADGSKKIIMVLGD